jgi:hypothetical protein
MAPSQVGTRAQQQAAALASTTQADAASQYPVTPGTPTDRTGQVWMGGTRSNATDREHSNRSEAATGNPLYSNETWMGEEQAKAHLTEMSDEEYAKLLDAATRYYGKTPSSSEIESFWNRAVERSKAVRDTSGKKVSPFDVYGRMAAAMQKERGDRQGPVTSVSTSTSTDTSRTRDVSVDLQSRSDSKALVNGAFKAALGREATKAEIKAFQAYLNERERENPTVTKSEGTSTTSSTSTTTQDQNRRGSQQTSDTVSSSDSSRDGRTVTRGGVNEQQAAEDYAQSMGPEYEVYQKATKYLDAFNRAIMSPVG